MKLQQCLYIGIYKMYKFTLKTKFRAIKNCTNIVYNVNVNVVDLFNKL